MFAEVNAEPLIFSTDEDRTYDISSPVPKIRAFYPLRFFFSTRTEREEETRRENEDAARYQKLTNI